MKKIPTASIEEHTGRILNELADLPGGLLPILHRLQEEFDYIPAEAVAIIARRLQLSRAEVHGVISFYHFFRTTPPGRHTLYVCRAEACQAMGGKRIEAHLQATLGVDWHGTTADERFTLEPVYCLGNCACAPSVMLDEQVIGRVSTARLDTLIKSAGSK